MRPFMAKPKKPAPQNWGPISLAFTRADAYRRARKQRRLNVEQLAELANVDKGVVLRLENEAKEQGVEDWSRTAVLRALKLTPEEIQSAILRTPVVAAPDWMMEAKRAAEDFAKAVDKGIPRDGPQGSEAPPDKRRRTGSDS
jgi:hypothetical protein